LGALQKQSGKDAGWGNYKLMHRFISFYFILENIGSDLHLIKQKKRIIKLFALSYSLELYNAGNEAK
jgi:hypothetical protein